MPHLKGGAETKAVIQESHSISWDHGGRKSQLDDKMSLSYA